MVTWIAACHDATFARGGNKTRAIAMPIGQLAIRIDSATAVLSFGNQSVTIFVTMTFRNTAPVPETMRPVPSLKTDHSDRPWHQPPGFLAIYDRQFNTGSNLKPLACHITRSIAQSSLGAKLLSCCFN